jgi:histidine ammonia-lyase
MLELNGQILPLEQIEAVARGVLPVRLADEARRRVEKSRRVVEKIVDEGRVVYGVNTGFGKLSDVRIAPQDVGALQLNLIRSHACGIGQPYSEAETRALMLLRANVLALGYSGARPTVIDALLAMLERGVHPIVPEKGSVGASGDLAPLAHLALAVIGEGEAVFQGERMAGGEALQRAGLAPVKLEAKEGLALLNGTQMMTAVGALALARAARLAHAADVAGAMTLEALKGTPAAFDERIHTARPHPGQAAVARHLRELLAGSEIRESHRERDPRVQDAYSLRCMPQVHGAARGALSHVRQVLEIETASGTDNPLVFAEQEELISGGNFHGAPVALALDYAAIALTDLLSIAERRINRLVHPDYNEGLPPFLSPHAGLSSGFMMLQVTAAALLSESRVLAHPASVDNVSTDGGKEDHVSMGVTAALKLRTIVQNLAHTLAVELLAAAEGLEYRRPLRAGAGVERAYETVRRHAPRVAQDRSTHADLERLAAALCAGEFDTEKS